MDERIIIDLRDIDADKITTDPAGQDILRKALDLLGERAVIRIVLVDIRSYKARIGIEAADGIPAHREEVYEAIHAEEEEEEVK